AARGGEQREPGLPDQRQARLRISRLADDLRVQPRPPTPGDERAERLFERGCPDGSPHFSEDVRRRHGVPGCGRVREGEALALSATEAVDPTDVWVKKLGSGLQRF